MQKQIKIICPNCDGTGIDPDSLIDKIIDNEQLTINNNLIGNKCKDCKGKGYVIAIGDKINIKQIRR